MKELRLAVASEPMLDEYRRALIGVLRSDLSPSVQDLNSESTWRTEEELVANCIEKVLSGLVDFVVLVSRSGNGLQIVANKHERIRAAPIPSVEYVGEAATLDANMCEVAAAIHDIRSAVEIIVAFARARKRAK